MTGTAPMAWTGELISSTGRLPAWFVVPACGALAATGFQPLGWWPVMLVALAFLTNAIFNARNRRAAVLLGWLFGVAYFTVGNNWIATAFTYQAEMPPWLGWIAVFLLAVYLAVYPALAALGARMIGNGNRIAFAVAFAGCWIFAEWLRGWVFTGFAWNPLGVTALGGFAVPGLARVAPWMGTYALSGLVVLLAGLWWLAVPALARREIGNVTLAAMAIPPFLFLAPWPVPDRVQGTMPFTLVQPYIAQDRLNDPAHFETQFIRTAILTGTPAPLGSHRLVLWPESGVPDYLRPGYPQRYYRQTTFAADPALARARIAETIGPGSLLLTGTVDLVIDPAVRRASAARNVVTAIGPGGKIAGGYAKAHLVPYGEYLPMRWLLEPIGLSRLVAGTLDFEAGPGPRTLDLGPWGKAGVQICYEIVFPGAVVDAGNRPDYIVNPSNDGWFGSWGPPQHLAQARLRAIEEGLPVLRPTTTGISAVIDANGVVRSYRPRNVASRIQGLVPPAASPTLFARFGNGLSLSWAMLLIGAAMVARRRGRV